VEETNIPESIIKQEFDHTTEKLHVAACWIGIVLNLVWFLGDYLSIPEYWIPFLNFRLFVSAISFVLLILKKQLKLSIYSCLFILVLGISIQNAYMWSVMDIPHLQKHAFAYMVLFIGVGMLVLWEMKLSLILVAVTIISNIVFYQLNSHLTIDEFITNGGLLVLTVLIFMVYLIRNRYRLTYKEIRSRLELEKSKTLIELQKEEVEEKNEEIKSSIRYAKRIQDSLLPPDELMDELFHQNYFVYHKPKDIVSGDFYWAAPVSTTSETPYYLSLAAVVDCTGHGVPGAFMSIVGSNFLKQSLTEKAVNNVAEALDFLNHKVISTLNQSSNTESKVRDGMDVALIALDYAKNKLYYSGANNAIYVLRKQTKETEIITLKATKQAIGSVSDTIQTYRLEIFDLQKGDTIYLFSDGYADQFGDVENKKLNYKRFKAILTEVFDLPIHQQKALIQSRFESWLGNAEQTDDVCVMGIKI